jgi:hypothetical protein
MNMPEIKRASSGWWVVADGQYATVAETREEALRRYQTLLLGEPPDASGEAPRVEVRAPAPA